MRAYFDDLDRTLTVMDDFRRRMSRIFSSVGDGAGYASAWPRVNLYDNGSALQLTAELPGITEKDVQITLNQDVLTVSGERKADKPEGYSVHRQERYSYNFSRSFSLPAKVNAEKTSAQMKNGVLTITMEKTPESQPRQIAVKGS